MSQASEGKTPSKTVLLCEDEAIVAMDIQFMIEDWGFEVIGPFADKSSAKTALADTVPDIAVLDVNLRDGQVYPLADTLREKGVRLIFHSGHVDDLEINERYPGAETCMKPIEPLRLKNALMTAEA
ncbi:response regulator [Pseudooceanicola sp. MF1-13]|uniref:response regulator n=1 Tax=Pseudooceanicola sp. MF1-13 TaxID=3379095 RepID=UPI0038924E9F